MDVEEIREARVKAEKAIADMKDERLREKAFEVILGRLLQENGSSASGGKLNKVKTPRQAASAARGVSKTLPDRILLLKQDDFFGSQRSMKDIRTELAAHGWHYPNTALSGTLQSLTRRRELRRLQVLEGKKKVWKYSNP
ncbi:MAG TPA: hypothetical protein VK828_03485 [Terriglobales bacterium]|jgi:hypothetical protein|nr:hypothetical protein [Terriglobales bacterium]